MHEVSWHLPKHSEKLLLLEFIIFNVNRDDNIIQLLPTVFL